MNNLASFCDNLETAIFDAAKNSEVWAIVDVRVNNAGVIATSINIEDKPSFKIIFRNGVVAVYKNNEIQNCYFECDHVLTDPVDITAHFYLGLCDLLPATEHLPIE